MTKQEVADYIRSKAHLLKRKIYSLCTKSVEMSGSVILRMC